MRDLPDNGAGVTRPPDEIPARVEGPDEGRDLVNGAFQLCGYHARALVVPPGEPIPAGDRPRVIIRMSHGHRLVLLSEGPTDQELAGLAQLKRTSEECGRPTTFFDDWRVFKARIFGGGYYLGGYQVDA